MSSDNESIGDHNGDIRSDTPLETEVSGAVTQEGNSQPNNKEDDSNDESKEKKVVKPKRIIRNPQPKLNEQTLKTARGLPAIKGHFQNLKTKGRGYEEHDLNVIMKTYEYWCHRLFPKYTFDDCIERLDKLGSKRATQTYLRKIRLGMDDLEDENFVENNDEIPTSGFVEPSDEQFDQLIATSILEPQPELSEEQLERIRQNKMRAETLRNARLSNIGQLNQSSHQSTSVDPKQTQTPENQMAEMEVGDDSEVDINSMLSIINGDPHGSSINNEDEELEKNRENAVSHSIRSSLFKSLLKNSDEEDEAPAISRDTSPKKNSILDSGESEESSKESEDSDTERIVFSKFNRRRKHMNYRNNEKSLNRKNKKSVKSSDSEDGDEETAATKNQNKLYKQKKTTFDSDENSNVSIDIISQQSKNISEAHEETDKSSDSDTNNVTLKNSYNSDSDERFSNMNKTKNKKKTIESDEDFNAHVSKDVDNEIELKKKRTLIESDDSNLENHSDNFNTVNKNEYSVANGSMKQKKMRSLVESDDSNGAVSKDIRKTGNYLGDTSDEEVPNNSSFTKRRNVIASDEDD